MENIMPSPWWYRKRALIFGAIYLIGFLPIASYHSIAQDLRIVPLAVVLTFLSWALRVWGSSYLRPSIVWSADSRCNSLVTDGPFAYTRNPLYLGNVLLACGFGLLAPPAGWAFINIADMAFVVMLIRWEERGMRARFGDRFEAYCARVPQLFPRLTPARGVRIEPSLREGMSAEIFTGAVLAGSIAVASSASYGWLAFFVLYILGITTQTLVARKRAAA
jgi:protein-S-isoprenylcysteine O-methyltransferase Ste14